MNERKIRVLIVEDSAVSRQVLQHVMGRDPQLEVVGVACNGEEALLKVAELSPDVITMDIHLPKLNGFETTRRIMETKPVPIIIVSASADPADVRKAFRVMDAGAVAVLETPRGPGHPRHEMMAARLVRTIKLMSEVRVVKRSHRATQRLMVAPPAVQPPGAHIDLIAMGASTGGPPVLQTILGGLSKNQNVPILIVQHIAAGFAQGLVEWLAASTKRPVELAVHDLRPRPGHVYIAPDNHHLVVTKAGRLALTTDPPDNGLRPAVSHLFRSVAECFGPRAIGVLLTGMGRDGAEELKLMRARGAVTFAQDQESAVVFGMCGEAVKIDAARYVLPPLRIAQTIDMLLNKNSQAGND